MVYLRSNHIFFQALDNPSLLQKEFSPSQFSRNIWKKDLGKQVLCRTGYMKGW